METINPNTPEATSADLIAQNLATLKQLFPDLITEDGEGTVVDLDVLKQLVGDRTISDAEEKYGLNWHGKRAARKLALTPSAGTLRPAPDDSVNWNSTQNVMIEGDNLEVLKLLQRSYAKRIDVIYIDPPYNTGKDFVYTDDFRDNIKNYMELTSQVDDSGKQLTSNSETSGRFHTNWLNMMYPRLKCARSLLASDGVIMVSIDDNEVANLRLICDEVFGEENFIAQLIWEKGRKNDAKLISNGHDYIVVYAKQKSHLTERGIRWREAKPGAAEIQEEYLRLKSIHGDDLEAIQEGIRGFYKDLPKGHPSKKHSRYGNVDHRGVWRDDNMSWPGGGGPTYDVIHPETGLPCKVPEGGWRYSTPEKMKQMIDAGKVQFREDHTEPPIRKTYLVRGDDALEESEDEEEFDELDDDVGIQVAGSYFYRSALQASNMMLRMFGGKVFTNPKDHEVLARWINYVTSGKKTATVLDFFAGSGSTAHAVTYQNAVDGGQRRYILVQLPEPLDPKNKDQRAAATLCDQLGRPQNLAEVTKERLRRAGTALQEEYPDWQGDTGFRVFRLDSSNLRPWDPDRDSIEQSLLDHLEHVKPDRSECDLLFELLLTLGLDLSLPIETRSIGEVNIQAVGGGTLFACLSPALDADAAEAVALGIVEWCTERRPNVDTTCVFRDAAFADDVAKTNLVAILQQHGITNIKSV